MEKVFKVSFGKGYETEEVKYVTEKFFSKARGYEQDDIDFIKDMSRDDQWNAEYPNAEQKVELLFVEGDIVTDGKGNKAIFREPVFQVQSSDDIENGLMVDVTDRNGSKVDLESNIWGIETTEVIGDSSEPTPVDDLDINELTPEAASALELESEEELKDHKETLEKLEAKEISVEEAAHEIAESHHKYNDKDYKYYVLDSENKIISGWEYKEDARDFQKEQQAYSGRLVIVSKRQLKDIGIDPDNDENWGTGNKPSDKDILTRAVNWYEHEIEHKVVKKIEAVGLQNEVDVNYIKEKISLAESNINALQDVLKSWIAQVLDMYSIGVLDIANNATKLGLSKTASEMMAEYKKVTQYRNKLD